jgi:hypothetical protein
VFDNEIDNLTWEYCSKPMPTLTTLQLQTNPKIEGIWAHVRMGEPPVIDADNNVDGDADERATNKEGYTAFGYLPSGNAYVLLRGVKQGYRDQLVGPIAMPHDDLITVELQRAPLSRITASGLDLICDGRRWFGKGCSDFLLYKRFLDGEDTHPVLHERAALGANILRVFGMCENITRFHPQDYGSRYYDQVRAFHELLASYGLYTYFTVFADTRLVMADAGQQREHYQRMMALLDILEVGNELNQHDNNIAFEPDRPTGILACRGSYGGQPAANPPMMTTDWDFGDFHARRDYPKAIVDMPVIQLQMGDTTDGLAHPIPIWHGEPQGFGPAAKRWQDPARARQLAGTARGTACGIFFHSDCGIQSTLFDDVTKRCAEAFFAELA